VEAPPAVKGDSAAGNATYTFSVPREDNYVVQIFVDNPNNYTYIDVSMDGGVSTRVNFINTAFVKPTSGFEWRSVFFSPASNSQIGLISGQHTFQVKGGHANIKIDKIRVTKMEKAVSPNITATANIEGNVAVMNAGLKLEGQDATSCYFQVTSQTYVCGIRNGMTKFEALVKLPRVLNPGDYWVFVKGKGAGDFQVGVTDQVTQRVLPVENDEDGLWTKMGHLKVTSNIDYVVVTFFKKGILSNVELPNILGLYITNDYLERLNKSDVVIKDLPPSSGGSSVIKKGNLIPNGSFESGLMSDWILLGRYDVVGQVSKLIPFNSITDNSVGYSGNNSIKIVPNRVLSTMNPAGDFTYQYLDSRVYHLESGKDYTLSFKAKSSNGKKPRITASLVNENDKNIRTDKIFFLNDNWQTLSVKTTASGGTSADYRIKIFILGWGSESNSVVWLDDFQLEEGDMTDYVPANDVEVGLSFNKPANLFLENETVSGVLKFYNAKNESQQRLPGNEHQR
jgi:hypothetical protein